MLVVEAIQKNMKRKPMSGFEKVNDSLLFHAGTTERMAK